VIILDEAEEKELLGVAISLNNHMSQGSMTKKERQQMNSQMI
jgi:hypothetical protein